MKPGRLWPLDANGHIHNDARRAHLTPPFDAVVAAALRAYTDHIGPDIDSIYVTGSVARDVAVAGVSDLNMFAVLNSNVDPDLVLQDWVYAAEEAILEQHPCVSDVQLERWPYYYVFDDPARFSIGAFIIKTHSVCLWGGDLSTQLLDYNVSPAIANDDLVRIGPDMADAIDAIEADTSADNVSDWCWHLSKDILRAGFGLVQMSEGVHTRDIDLCYTYFAQHYPDHADEMRRVLDCAQTPSGDADEVLRLLDEVRRWLLPLVDVWLDAHNPQRDLALLVDDLVEIEE